MLFLSFDGTAFIFWKMFSFYCFTLTTHTYTGILINIAFSMHFDLSSKALKMGASSRVKIFKKSRFLVFFPDFVHSYHLFFYIRLCFLLVFLGSILSNISIRSSLYHHLLLWQHALSFGWRHLSKWTSI